MQFIVGIHHAFRFDKHRTAGGGNVVDNTFHIAAVFGFDRNHIPVVPHGNNRVLQKLLIIAGVNHGIQRVFDSGRGISYLPANGGKFGTCGISHFFFSQDGSCNPVLQHLVGGQFFNVAAKDTGLLRGQGFQGSGVF